MFPSSKPAPASGRSPTLAAIRCRPTRLGAGLLVVVFLLWLVGVNYQVNLAYVAAFWLLGFLAVGVLLNLRQLLALKIDVAMPQEVFAGQDAVLQLTAQSPQRTRFLWLCSEDDYLAAQRPSENIWQPWRAEEGSAAFDWRVPALLRGHLRVPPLRTASVAPFGLTVSQCVWHWPSDAVVYPAPIAHAVPAAAPRGSGETAERRPAEGGDEPAYLQAHRDGMPVQHIAWKTYAKTGEMLSKRFEEEVPPADKNIISYRDYPAGTPKDRLAGLLCRRVLDADRSGLPYILEMPQRSIAPQHGQREICLTALALW
ncbi:TPA: DUF58 domain-containing protein [Neisseria bacilliformis]|uniref:Uncharacterized protein n=1 Tax=Neisseria bacilliformis ATCC BAA-1200 TaxID=888742 RepID=F2B8E9_9NEIS|nr:DUF58 domain-containing protein [Neisseria bacilliformis]EGF12289.1 hypothetical protein HMPREF9123_0002 [Neisseria bacilliformis ATCC BAA-1200]QMT47401.1 DUF58 domain-containing protein [Neisseria bacilliformis]